MGNIGSDTFESQKSNPQPDTSALSDLANVTPTIQSMDTGHMDDETEKCKDCLQKEITEQELKDKKQKEENCLKNITKNIIDRKTLFDFSFCDKVIMNKECNQVSWMAFKGNYMILLTAELIKSNDESFAMDEYNGKEVHVREVNCFNMLVFDKTMMEDGNKHSMDNGCIFKDSDHYDEAIGLFIDSGNNYQWFYLRDGCENYMEMLMERLKWMVTDDYGYTEETA